MAAPTTLTSELVVEYALRVGASLAGVAQLEARSVLVLALTHNPDEPELDYWGVPGGTQGNRTLMGLSRAIVAWLEQEFAVRSRDLPYHADQGGIYLKDAAVLAGLGCIGKNNLLLTPEFGPLVRLRALAVEAPLPPTGPPAFDPCIGCPEPCRSACPHDAFAQPSPERHGTLPARDGSYSRRSCERQMSTDRRTALGEDSLLTLEQARGTAPQPPAGLVRYCRLCELLCVLARRTRP